jgi:hypothetical protein
MSSSSSGNPPVVQLLFLSYSLIVLYSYVCCLWYIVDGHVATARPETVEVVFPSAAAATKADAEVASGYAAEDATRTSTASSCGSSKDLASLGLLQ